MEKWLDSVYSDGTAEFVSSPSPKLFEWVTIRLRMYEDAPVRYVLLRSVPNGADAGNANCQEGTGPCVL